MLPSTPRMRLTLNCQALSTKLPPIADGDGGIQAEPMMNGRMDGRGRKSSLGPVWHPRRSESSGRRQGSLSLTRLSTTRSTRQLQAKLRPSSTPWSQAQAAARGADATSTAILDPCLVVWPLHRHQRTRSPACTWCHCAVSCFGPQAVNRHCPSSGLACLVSEARASSRSDASLIARHRSHVCNCGPKRQLRAHPATAASRRPGHPSMPSPGQALRVTTPAKAQTRPAARPCWAASPDDAMPCCAMLRHGMPGAVLPRPPMSWSTQPWSHPPTSWVASVEPPVRCRYSVLQLRALGCCSPVLPSATSMRARRPSPPCMCMHTYMTPPARRYSHTFTNAFPGRRDAQASRQRTPMLGQPMASIAGPFIQPQRCPELVPMWRKRQLSFEDATDVTLVSQHRPRCSPTRAGARCTSTPGMDADAVVIGHRPARAGPACSSQQLLLMPLLAICGPIRARLPSCRSGPQSSKSRTGGNAHACAAARVS